MPMEDFVPGCEQGNLAAGFTYQWLFGPKGWINWNPYVNVWSLSSPGLGLKWTPQNHCCLETDVYISSWGDKMTAGCFEGTERHTNNECVKEKPTCWAHFISPCVNRGKPPPTKQEPLQKIQTTQIKNRLKPQLDAQELDWTLTTFFFFLPFCRFGAWALTEGHLPLLEPERHSAAQC